MNLKARNSFLPLSTNRARKSTRVEMKTLHQFHRNCAKVSSAKDARASGLMKFINRSQCIMKAKVYALPSESRERDGNTARAISLASTPIHSVHASISCCSREHFLFRLWTLAWRITISVFFKRRAKRTQSKKKKKCFTHPLNVDFS